MRLVLLSLIWATFAGAFAQVQKGDAPAALIDDARKEMSEIRDVLKERAEPTDDVTLVDARRRALAAQSLSQEAANALAGELAEVQTRLAQLGALAPGVKEPADIAVQRAQLVKSQSELDSQVKLAKLLAVEAEQAAASVSERRRSEFGAQLFERTHIVVSSSFWQELRSEFPADFQRLRALRDELKNRMLAVSWLIWLPIAVGFVALLLARKPIDRLVSRFNLTRVPAGRLRRSLKAAGVIVVWMFTPGLLAHAFFLALTSGASVSPALQALLAGFDGIVWFGGFCAGLGLALLMPAQPSWRLPPVSDAIASQLRWFPPALALAMVVGWLSARLSVAADASLVTIVAVRSLTSVTLVLLMIAALVQVRRVARQQDVARLQQDAAKDDGSGQAGSGKAEPAQQHGKNSGSEFVGAASPAPLWMSTLRTFLSLLLGITLMGLLSGYVALGSFVANQLVWSLVLATTTYFVALLIDDLFMTLLAPTAAPADDVAKDSGRAVSSGARTGTREQVAVVLSGFFRIALLLIALVLLLAPFGEGPSELFRRAGRVGEGFSIGEIRLLPATLLQGVLVLVIGFLIVKVVKSWLGDRFMPTTRMDAGMRMSITTLFGYVGGITVVALAMSAVGVGLERVAWVASALSVGIGFGLQAVVQNFVSGLILLAERPVKVGDWVSLAGVEGDIRRINVRATEIQMGDRSTVIVPNSEFITKIVRNVTFTDPIGMVQIKLPMPLATDTQKTRAVLLEAFLVHPGVLESPKPTVQLDGIDGLHLIFNATGFVSSPRASSGVKSDLLFDVMERLREAGLTLELPPTMLMSPATAVPAGLPEGIHEVAASRPEPPRAA